MSLDLAKATFLIVNGDDGNTGLPKGYYMYFNQNNITNLLDILKKFVNQQGNLFKGAKLDLIDTFNTFTSSLPIGLIRFGFYITEGQMGFRFAYAQTVIVCSFKTRSFEFSCQYNFNYVSAVLGAGKWMVKKATSLFEFGSEVLLMSLTPKNPVQFALDAKNLAVEAVQKWDNYMSQKAAEYQAKLDKIKEDAEKIAEQKLNAGLKLLQDLYQDSYVGEVFSQEGADAFVSFFTGK
jgi:hypothetical protein